MRLLKIIFFGYFSTAMMPLYSAALLSKDMTLYQLTDRADLVFQGSARKIEYKLSDDGILNTFVSYDVEDVIKGSYQEPNITLRFVGGSLASNGETLQLTASHALQIKKGEQGIMMVQGNDFVACPLVGCRFGRFEFVNGYVVDAEGRMMSMDTYGNIVHARHFMDLMAAEMGSDIEAKSTAQKSMVANSALMSRHFFVEYLRRLVNKRELAYGVRCEHDQRLN